MAKVVQARVHGYKCFLDSGTSIEPDGVTALTGANDGGKSSFLYALNLFFNPSQSILEDEVCSAIAVNSLPAVQIGLECQRDSELQGFANLRPGQRVMVKKTLYTGSAELKYEIDLDGTWRSLPQNHAETFFPRILFLTPEMFRHKYSPNDPQSRTAHILHGRFGFGSPMAAVHQYSHEIGAKSAISKWVETAWTVTQRKDFDFVRPGGDISYIVRDEAGEFRPLNLFGSGFQHFTTMVIRVEDFLEDLEKQKPDRDGLILIDEPENSLHPGAQRSLFRYLSSRGKRVQIIYATHSTSLIDQRNPRRIRVFIRDANARNVKILSKKSSHDNYESVRMALGIVPADSLLFGRLNIVVEGAIEYLCLPIIARKLEERGGPHLDFSQVALINGQGSEVPRMFRLALSTNQPTVAIVDNDSTGRRYADAIHQELNSVGVKIQNPVIKWDAPNMDGDSEFEDFLPIAKYVEATNNICKPTRQITIEAISKRLPRAKSIEHLLKEQNIKFDEHKTDIALRVVHDLIDQELKPFENIVEQLGKLLDPLGHVQTVDLE